jgi:hypothetical protein
MPIDAGFVQAVAEVIGRRLGVPISSGPDLLTDLDQPDYFTL